MPHAQHHRAAAAADPVIAAAVERETNPALVAVARAGGLQVYAVDSVEHKAALRASYAPLAERFMALSPTGAASVKSALVAWSAADAGVVCYCSRATAGKIVVFNAANSTVTRVLDTVLGGLSGPRCLSVAFKPGGGGDIVAVGGDKGVEFIELSSRWGCVVKSSSKKKVKKINPLILIGSTLIKTASSVKDTEFKYKKRKSERTSE